MKNELIYNKGPKFYVLLFILNLGLNHLKLLTSTKIFPFLFKEKIRFCFIFFPFSCLDFIVKLIYKLRTCARVRSRISIPEVRTVSVYTNYRGTETTEKIIIMIIFSSSSL